MYPGLTPVQVRKWIRSKHLLETAVPTAKLIPRQGRAATPKKSPRRPSGGEATSTAATPAGIKPASAADQMWTGLHCLPPQQQGAVDLRYAPAPAAAVMSPHSEAFSLAPQSAMLGPYGPHGTVIAPFPPPGMLHSAPMSRGREMAPHHFVAMPGHYQMIMVGHPGMPPPPYGPQPHVPLRVLAPVHPSQQSPDPTVHDGSNGVRMKDALALLTLGHAQEQQHI